ncbi:sensor histidine kinase [Paenibacillus silvae]|uniref:histidine kinase n=1 Tax=Paenibacillus silvae TaxID=1325358 RepID=A0A2W6NBV9_9BACL|nr:HAMP domain-containing sensor histidine kinase [Paenibacillus silvae]PZT53099.1 sensor histidine kinase [Paenibacillus silvae]
MLLHTWSTRWLKASSVILLLILLCSFGLILHQLSSRSVSGTMPTMNQVRLKVNPLLLELEQQRSRLHDPAVKERLRSAASKQNLAFTYVGLDGTILLSSTLSSEGTSVNLRSALHYSLTDALQAADEDASLQLAFPLMDGPDGRQIGNVIFTVPQSLVYAPQSVTWSIFMLGGLVLLILILMVLLIRMERSVKRKMLTPVRHLKHHAESILKGKYDEQIQYNHSDEIGELYAMLDLMRLEIMHLSRQRIRQEKAQKELITNISHDLKTPITTLKAYIEAISEGLYTDEQTLKEYIEIMHIHTDKIARLIEDLLVHALHELGQISVEPQELYSRTVFGKMLKPIAHIVRSRELTYEEPEVIPNVLIRIDPVRIEQVVDNLVSNALKHTTPGDSIRINAEVNSGQFTLTIADSGQGMRAQDMPFIFERYFRGGPSSFSTPVQEGTGLGLSICKSIIEAHGGQIHFSSKAGQGTVFQFSLPLC